MSSSKTEREVTFLPSRSARFHFQCRACGRCCGEYRIVLSPYDILRLKRATRRTTTELIRRGTVRITREPFKKVFGFAPVADLFDMFGLSSGDTVPVAVMGFRAGASGKEECEFLSAAIDGKRLCGIYEDRPGACRLHPLGCVTAGGRRRWFFRRPLCETNEDAKQTVEEWVQTSRMRPFLRANARYLRWMRELLEECESFPSVSEREWQKLEQILYDFDSVRTGAGRITMDTIEAMFREWLSRVKARK